MVVFLLVIIVKWTVMAINILKNIAGLAGTRLTDVMNQKSFIFIDITNPLSAVWSQVISASSVDVPEFEINIETKQPLNESINEHYFTTMRPGDLSITRGNFAHDAYSYNIISSLEQGDNTGAGALLAINDWLPRRDYLLIHFINFRFFQWSILGSGEYNKTPEEAAEHYLAADAIMSMTNVLNNGIPGVAYVFKNCLINSYQPSDGFDASSPSLSFNSLGFSVGKMAIVSLTNPAELIHAISM